MEQRDSSPSSTAHDRPASKTHTISDIMRSATAVKRYATGISELDRMLMGGFVSGQVVLLGAEPGFGKSTLCLSVIASMSSRFPTLYASGEESEQQIAQRAVRMHIDNDSIHIMSTKSIDDVLATADSLSARVVIVDSLQTMEADGITGTQGGSAQSKEAAYRATEWAKRTGSMMILVSQFTKGDEVAGSNMIAHIVDTILIGDSDDNSRLKFLRSRKNRFGRTDEVGVFVHEDDGLKPVVDPSGYLIGDENAPVAGSALSIMRDGVRMLPVEIDALAVQSTYSNPQRQFSGMDSSRTKILVAALSKYGDERMSSCDVFSSTINGIRLTDPMTDLAVIAGMESSLLGIEPRGRTAWIGEVALTGMIRGRSMIEERVREAERLGFDKVVIPGSARVDGTYGISIEHMGSISEIKDML